MGGGRKRELAGLSTIDCFGGRKKYGKHQKYDNPNKNSLSCTHDKQNEILHESREVKVQIKY
eukprot:723509-Ditylum_brightwellii.AAC.1